MTLQRKKTRRDSDDQIGWAVVGDKGAIEFWMFTSEEMMRMDLGGVETHRRTPFEYSQSDTTPDHDHCVLLDGPCWHDGTSLWAAEYWIPMYRTCGEDWVWQELESTYQEAFK